MPPDLRDLADRIEQLALVHPAAPRVFWILTQAAIDVRAIATVVECQAGTATRARSAAASSDPSSDLGNRCP
jgi:hypothetical protein